MKKFLAVLLGASLLTLAPPQTTPAHAGTYIGDWRMTVHLEPAENCFSGTPCTTFNIRTNQPGWEGSDQYLVRMTLDGQEFYGDAGQTNYGEVDPDFYGVRATGSTAELSVGPHTLVLDWLYMGVWSCGPSVPNGCGWVGRERVTKVYKFRWAGAGDQVVRPFVKPSSSVSASARRVGQKVTVRGVVRAQRLTSNFVRTSTYYPVRGARATLQSYSTTKRKWVSRKTVTANSRGVVTLTLRSARALKWRWVVPATSAYLKSVSRTVKK